MDIERRLQDCYPDCETFVGAYWKVYSAMSEAALLTGFQARRSACADEESVPYDLWDENATVVSAFHFEMNREITHGKEGEPKPNWLGTKKKPIKEPIL